MMTYLLSGVGSQVNAKMAEQRGYVSLAARWGLWMCMSFWPLLCQDYTRTHTSREKSARARAKSNPCGLGGRGLTRIGKPSSGSERSRSALHNGKKYEHKDNKSSSFSLPPVSDCDCFALPFVAFCFHMKHASKDYPRVLHPPPAPKDSLLLLAEST